MLIFYFINSIIFLIKKQSTKIPEKDPFLLSMQRAKKQHIYYRKFKFVILGLFIILLIVTFAIRSPSVGAIFLSIVFYIFLIPFVLLLDFPYWLLYHYKECGCQCCGSFCNNVENQVKNIPTEKFPNLPIVSGFVFFCCFSCYFPLFIICLFLPIERDLPDIDFDPTTINFSAAPRHNRDYVQTPLCYLTIHHLSTLQLIALSNQAYMNQSEHSLHILNSIFFNDSSLTIQAKGFICDSNIKMAQFDIAIKDSSANVTVLAIRGSMTRVDWWLDVQLFCSSAFLTLTRVFSPFVNKVDSYAFRYAAKWLSFPMKTMLSMTIILEYLQELTDAYNKNLPNFEKNIIFVGHSLGGSLAKLMGKKFQKAVFSVSGPGITVLVGLYEPDKGYNENFPSTFIDIIPDQDLVPRFEVSGGTEFRVLCNLGAGICHIISHTLCMVSLMCGRDYMTEKLCQFYFSEDMYESMKKLSDVVTDL
jgi:hypothetical protein